jgi:hypothetical protein
VVVIMKTRVMFGVVGIVGAISLGCGRSTGSEATAGGGTSASSTSASSTGGGTGAGPLGCTGDPTGENTTDACGVFVQADAPGTTEDGTMPYPYKSIQNAVDHAGNKRVYVCTSAPFAEAVVISTPVEIYGGFDCANAWAWSPDARTTLNGPADKVALVIEKGATRTTVSGFTITAASPSDPKGGGSSIGAALDDVPATLVRCDVKAGDAADGPDGQFPPDPTTNGADAPMPDPLTMNACINPPSLMPGAPGVTVCGDGMTSGGPGGKGGITGTNNGNGQTGGDGSPLPNPNPTMAGSGGVGQTDPTDPTKRCQDGRDGLDGAPGGAGPSGSAAGDTLWLAGISNGDMTDGQPGTRGQGGGGGGGAMSGMFCLGGVDGNGASGGGGGAGGCGGLGGGGGKAGGSSIAIVSLGPNVTLTSVTVSTGKGGKGGNGSVARGGGQGGNQGIGGSPSNLAGSRAGCTGGYGGNGGPGGSGGGGRGGHSIGIAYRTGPATMPTLQMFTPGTPGGGGTAGSGAPSSSNGAGGNEGQCWDFSAGAACQ